MYTPAPFRQDDMTVQHDFIRRSRLAVIVVSDGDTLDANHVPVLLDAEDGPYGTLVGHLARANPQARPRTEAIRALAVFSGPDAYVSPGWYPSKQATGKAVPTWNYVAVHAHGRLELIEDAAAKRAIVARLSELHEAGRPTPWRIEDAPPDFIDAQLAAIVGFRLRIERLEGKWKLSQNRPPEDRAGVTAALADGGAAERAVAELMAGTD
ncbi:MAG: FMN-binding negative transcriptional regulator [Alphaproteobacteria bacterium]|nr:FMN-binding negative transcriptional regulator [Alphaproteobacteria bacterium]